jgi:hypothetical protein
MAIYMEAGKGSAPRQQADYEKYKQNWDVIFGKKSAPTNTEPLPVNNTSQEHINE